MFWVFFFDSRIDIKVNEIRSGKFFENEEVTLEAELLKHKIKTCGYSITGKNKRKINLNYIKKLGVPEGPLLGKLQSGKDVLWKGKKVSVGKATSTLRGKKITIINDTVPCKGANILAKDADLLICEATYSSDLERKAKEYGHMSARQAAELANRSNAKKLVLTHFSARYKNTDELKEDAMNCFRVVSCAEDFLEIDL